MDIEKTYNKLSKAIDKAYRAMQEFKESVKGVCTHPEKLQSYHDEDRDDGYGRWWKQKVRVCKACGQEFYEGRENEWREVHR